MRERNCLDERENRMRGLTGSLKRMSNNTSRGRLEISIESRCIGSLICLPLRLLITKRLFPHRSSMFIGIQALSRTRLLRFVPEIYYTSMKLKRSEDNFSMNSPEKSS